MSSRRAARGSVLQVPVDELSQDDVVRTLLEWTGSAQPRVAVGINANVCNLAARDHTFRDRLSAVDLCYADGQSIVWAGRALGVAVPERVATTDLVYPLAAECARQGKRMFLFGAAPGIAEQAGAKLAERAPGLQVATCDGFVPAERMDEVLERIRSHRTDVLLVGLGDPLQQEWIAKHRATLGVPVILSCGGLFDWTSGSHRRAPRWMIRAGLEWLWRLIIEPRRLAKRYLLGNPAFMARFVAEYLRHRRTRTG